MSAPRYDRMRSHGMDIEPPDAATLASNEAIFQMQQAWCAKKNNGAHCKLPGTSTCLDCGTDLDA